MYFSFVFTFVMYKTSPFFSKYFLLFIIINAFIFITIYNKLKTIIYYYLTIIMIQIKINPIQNDIILYNHNVIVKHYKHNKYDKFKIYYFLFLWILIIISTILFLSWLINL